jgi:hypothetical protein
MGDREMARRVRDGQWKFMEKVHALGTIWWCIWNKERKPELADEYRNCLLSGMELNEWMSTHPDWWEIGEWSDDRYARPVRLTDVGMAALASRDVYDMEPVTGGLVEPGYIVDPLPASA